MSRRCIRMYCTGSFLDDGTAFLWGLGVSRTSGRMFVLAILTWHLLSEHLLLPLWLLALSLRVPRDLPWLILVLLLLLKTHDAAFCRVQTWE